MTTEKMCTGSFAYTRDDFQAVIEAVADGRIDPSPLVTSRIRLREVVDSGIERLLGPDATPRSRSSSPPEPLPGRECFGVS
ncbi:hypothetical protein [Saccharopolyspora oryzae]|uniref:Uncharacterized protein n=1 Tax=Saccharopolyspora oryzae TaxID=2997343 RepID=A0ABT4UU45_9PSEU|nr:hypothetical protein [Saccharopolyspora oryzae]MDA3625230.1 hypothetical protein [Saccharopolyspora oryzae]